MAFQKPSHTFTKIHLKGLQTNKLNLLFILSFTVFINTFSLAQDLPKTNTSIKPDIKEDSIALSVNSVLKTPENPKVIDSVKQDSVKPDETLKDVVKYKATDYVSMNRRKNTITLYNEAQVIYQDMQIDAGVIVINNNNDLVYAGRLKDTAGNYSQKPILKQGVNIIEPDSIIFNRVTRKALIFNSVSEQSGGTIIAEKTKRENDSVYFIGRGKFTTSENLEDPEYYFLMNKAKVVPGKKVVTGFTQMYVYDVPTPIALPFAFFPMSEKHTSGIIFPSFGEDTANDRGYFLQNGGYYFAISDNLDLVALGDYYTNGSYGIRLESNYVTRYKYSGNISFNYNNLLNSERGFSDFSQATNFNFQWSHRQDAKANPNSTFSASVNIGSSQFFNESINQRDFSNSFNNQFNSSISYSKTFQGTPQVNLNVAATHNQNTNTEQINLTLPTVQASMQRVYPFAPSSGTKKGIIENVNFQISSRGEYRISTTDSLFGSSEMFDDAVTSMTHSIPITTNFKIFDHFSMSASSNIEETWTLNTTERFFDSTTEELVTINQNGFDRFLTYNFSTSIGTTLYGLFNFEKEGKDPKIQAIRHVMRPSLSYSITPAFDQYYDTVQTGIAGNGDPITDEFTRF